MLEREMVDIPDEIWEQIIRNIDEDRYLEPLSLVSKLFLSITNRLKKTLTIVAPTTQYLPQFFHRFPNLRHISFAQFTGHLEWVLLQMSQFQFPIESLDLSHQTRFPTKVIQRFPSSTLRCIRSLKLSNLYVVNDDDLDFIASAMGNLEELDLSEPKDEYAVRADVDDVEFPGCPLGITDDGIAVISSKLTHLKIINLSGNGLISDKSVMSLSESCGKLIEIGVKNCSFVTHEGVCFALGNCVNLKALKLIGMEILASDIRDHLFSAQNLSELEFAYMGVSNELLCSIAKASLPLKKFTLFHCRNFTLPSIYAFIKTYQSLEYLALEGVDCLTDTYMVSLSLVLRRVHTIKLNYCSALSNSTLLILAKNCPLLTNLEMEKTGLGKDNFAVINVRNSPIRSLNVSGNKAMSNESLESFSISCPNIEAIDISGCSAVTRKGIGEIVRSCPGLRSIQMSTCINLRGLGVNVDVPNIEVLEASGSGFTDDGLVMIGRTCPNLKYLDVKGCSGVSSRGVKELVGNCTRLKEIDLGWCRNFSRDIVAWMVFSRPSLRKIVPPQGVVVSETEKSLFLQHGCEICELI